MTTVLSANGKLKGLRMRKLTLLLSILMIVAVSSTADAAKKGKAKNAKAAPVASLEPSDAQRVKFWQDAFNPAGAK